MNTNKVNEMLEYWHNKYERPIPIQNYQGIDSNAIIVFPSTNLFLKNYYIIEIKNIKNYYFISICENDDNLFIIGIYDLDKQNLINFNEIGVSFSFDEIVTDKWIDLKDFEQYLERIIE